MHNIQSINERGYWDDIPIQHYAFRSSGIRLKGIGIAWHAHFIFLVHLDESKFFRIAAPQPLS